MIKKHSSIYFYRTKANICLDKLYIYLKNYFEIYFQIVKN